MARKYQHTQKLVTDISYIRTEQGFLCLSVIRDFYDNSIIAHKMYSEQNIHLVLNTIKASERNEKVTAELQIHCGQGFQFTSKASFYNHQRIQLKTKLTPPELRRQYMA